MKRPRLLSLSKADAYLITRGENTNAQDFANTGSELFTGQSSGCTRRIHRRREIGLRGDSVPFERDTAERMRSFTETLFLDQLLSIQ